MSNVIAASQTAECSNPLLTRTSSQEKSLRQRVASDSSWEIVEMTGASLAERVASLDCNIDLEANSSTLNIESEDRQKKLTQLCLARKLMCVVFTLFIFMSAFLVIKTRQPLGMPLFFIGVMGGSLVFAHKEDKIRKEILKLSSSS